MHRCVGRATGVHSCRRRYACSFSRTTPTTPPSWFGSSSTIQVDTRIISATNRDLAAAVSSGDFRRDLYYRLHVFPITAPPLRERREDVPLLVALFVARFARRLGKVGLTVPSPVMRDLESYAWPGNVRELENVIERAAILAKGDTLVLDDTLLPRLEPGESAPSDDTLAEVERKHILQVLEKTRWQVAGAGGAAEQLGLKPSTLRSRMEKLGVHRAR